MGKKNELLQISTPLNTGRKFNVHENLKNITLNLKVLEKVANSPIWLGTVGFQMFIKQLSYAEAKCSNYKIAKITGNLESYKNIWFKTKKQSKYFQLLSKISNFIYSRKQRHIPSDYKLC